MEEKKKRPRIVKIAGDPEALKERSEKAYSSDETNRGDTGYEKKPIDEREERPIRNEESGFDRKPWEDRGSGRKPWEDRGSGRKPWEDRGYGRKPWEDRGSDRKPWEDRSADRPSRDERGGYDRPSRDERGGYDRPSRDDRSGYDRPSRDDRGGYDRPSRDDRGGYDRPSRDDRGGYDRPSRDDRGGYDRPSRDDRGGYDRPSRDDRGGYDRKPWYDRTDYGSGYDRPSRDDRGGYDRKPWQDRSNDRGGYDRPPRDDRGGYGRPPRDDRGGGYDRPPRDDRGGFERKPWQDRSNDRGGYDRPSRGGYDHKPRQDRNNDRGGGRPPQRGGAFGKKQGGKKPFNKREQEFHVERKPKPILPSGDGMTLNKYLAHCGLASRRKAVDFIREGEVTVNGEKVLEPYYRIQPGDVITCKGETVAIQERLVYLLLNKPKNIITTTSDEFDRPTIMDIVDPHYPERLYPVGRLDRETTGLILITNDGDLAQRMTHPSYRIVKQYRVGLDRGLQNDDIKRLEEGIQLDDGLAQVNWIRFAEDHPERNVAELEIVMGRNRVVRRMFEHLGYEVRKLDRFYLGGLTKRDLPRGSFRELSNREIIMLKHFTGHPSTGGGGEQQEMPEVKGPDIMDAE